jgi:hypothetical protein
VEGIMAKLNSGGPGAVATSEDIINILGEIDQDKLLAIVSLQPTVADVEAASMWFSGDSDVYGAGQPIHGRASEIITILSEGEEEEPPPPA